ncbi:MAG: hypothetical protein ACYSUH_02535 [Planctomycetota bacterium]|jgi:23S rRNA (adenine2503-C2)-methyltransferase
MDKDLKNKSFGESLEIATEHKQKSFCGKYLFEFIHQKNVNIIDDITPLSKLFRSQLIETGFLISKIDLLEQHDDPDGTIKFVFGLQGGTRIESVRLKDGDRNTLCISTQAGWIRCIRPNAFAAGSTIWSIWGWANRWITLTM